MATVSAPTEIVVYVCPECGWWQRWGGNCDSLCEHARTEPVTYSLVDDDDDEGGPSGGDRDLLA